MHDCGQLSVSQFAIMQVEETKQVDHLICFTEVP
jgi:hypothetical protein